ncbi:G-protein coupled receptor 135 isoform X2 [Odocoileus virginianus]|uniref:trans-L-3-hydroxyproline dehydratase n=1 Tax=Odocoileus virginianus TaxID=9874 RepID=A0ABM4ICH3_ODOVR
MAGPLTVPRLPPHDPGTPALSVVDMHTGGEPLRIVLAGCPEVVGPTLLAKRRYMRQHLDHVRRRLMFEPRGHRDMYGAVLVPSELPDAHLGVLFLNNEGYSSMCGHAVLALGRFALDFGLVPAPPADAREALVNIHCPCGLVAAFVECEGGRSRGPVRFHSVPAFVLAADFLVDVPGHGKVVVDVAYGGAFYAFVSAEKLGLDVCSAKTRDLVAAASAVTEAVKAQEAKCGDFKAVIVEVSGRAHYTDLLTALLCLPAAFLDLFTPPGGSAPAAAAAASGPWSGFCAASRFFSSCFGIVSTLSMALISLDRYCAIVRPPREKIGRRRALQLLAGAWLAALGFSMPWELFLAPGEAPAAAQSFHRCLYRTSPDPAQLGAAYSVGLVVTCYLLPFLLMCFCHYHICKTVRLSDVRVRPLTTYARVLRFFSDVRTATTVLIMIVSVICCWGPYCFLVLLAAARRAQAAQSPSLLNVVAVWLTWANGAINPVIYAVRNPNISMLLGRNREEGYRTRNVDALLPNQGLALQAGSLNPLRNRYTNRLGACSTISSSNPTSGVAGDMAMWARKNPVVLFCREGPPDPVTAAAKQSGAGDTSL